MIPIAPPSTPNPDRPRGVIRTTRLTGRAVAPGDLALLQDLFRDPGVGDGTSAAGGPWPEPRICASAAAFAAHWPAHDFGLRLWFEGPECGDAATFAGIAGLHLRVVDGRGAVEASYAFLPARRGRGLAFEAMTAALAEARDISREALAVSFAENARSTRLLARLGFVRIGANEAGGRTRLLFRRRIAARAASDGQGAPDDGPAPQARTPPGRAS